MQDDFSDPGRHKWLRRLLPVAVLAVGVALVLVLVKTGKPPRRKPRVSAGLLVETVAAVKQRRTIRVKSHGQVQPRRQVDVVAEVRGKVVRVHRNLVLGGFIRAGEVLLAIDPADYKLAVERARSTVAKSNQVLALEESNARVARREWKLLGSQVSKSATATPLALREPQLNAARANLASSRADLKLAQLNLKRTVIRAPFNLRVRSESVEVGHYVTAGKSVARVFGTDRAEVVVPLPLAEMRWLDLRHGRASEERARARVTLRQNTGSGTYEREGTLERTVGEIDTTGRMSKVVVGVNDPYNLTYKGQAYRPDLEVGSFVEVLIEGAELKQVVPIPAHALRLGSVVWIAGKDNKLQIKKVALARQTPTEALVSDGLEAGDRVVLTPITGAVQGMKLRIKGGAGAARAPHMLSRDNHRGEQPKEARD